MCSATQAVKCGVASSSPSSLASVSLSFRFHSYNFTLPHYVFILLAVILYQLIPLFSRSHFSHLFSVYSDGILGVVFTPPVVYSRPPSAVNDPTVTKQVNSGKSCLEEVSQLLVYQVALINQYWVRLHGDFHRKKESTKNLANSTMKKKNSVPTIVGFVELLLLFLSIDAR